MSINRDEIVEFKSRNYIGPKFFIVGTGDIKHKELVKVVSETFGNLPMLPPKPKIFDIFKSSSSSSKPRFTPRVMAFDEPDPHGQPLIKMSVFYEAPSCLDRHYYAFLLLESLLGDY